MKKIIYTLLIGLTMFVYGDVKAKTIEKVCEYYFYDQLSGGEVSLKVNIYSDLSTKGVITSWNHKNKSNSEGIKNWKDIKDTYASTKK